MFSRCGPLKVNRAGLSVTLIVAIAARRLFVAPVGAPERKSRGAQRGMHSGLSDIFRTTGGSFSLAGSWSFDETTGRGVDPGQPTPIAPVRG